MRGKKEIALFREKILWPLLEHGSQVRPKVLKVIKLDWQLLDLILGFIYTTGTLHDSHPQMLANLCSRKPEGDHKLGMVLNTV